MARRSRVLLVESQSVDELTAPTAVISKDASCVAMLSYAPALRGRSTQSLDAQTASVSSDGGALRGDSIVLNDYHDSVVGALAEFGLTVQSAQRAAPQPQPSSNTSVAE